MSEELISTFVTHVESDGPFIIIWLQKNTDRVACVQQVLAKLAENFDGRVCNAESLQESQLAYVKSKNGSIYRGRILSLQDLSTQGTVTVQLIDFGNTESIRVENIRVIDSRIPSVISQSQALATESILAGIVANSGSWPPNMIASINHNLCFTNVDCKVEDQIPFKDITTVYTQDVDLASSMVKLKYGTGMSVLNQKALAVTYYGAKMEQAALPVAGRHQTVAETSQEGEPVFRTMSRLEVGTECLVYMACVDNGIRGFSVQIQQKEKFLVDMMSDLNQCPRVPLRVPPVPGAGCFAIYPNDTSVCRALVTAVDNDMCKLYFLDYGSTASYSYTQLYEIPSKFLTFKPLSFKFALKGANLLPHDRVTHNWFIDIVGKKVLKMQVLPNEVGESIRQSCNLFLDDQNVLLLMLHRISCLSNSYPTLQLEENKRYAVAVSHVDSKSTRLPWDFYVHLESEVDKLGNLMEDVNKFCKVVPESNNLVVAIGCPILAKYPRDSSFYRARLLSKDGDMVVVKFVDYGNDELVKVVDTRPSHAELNNRMPAQGILCRLQSADTIAGGAARFSDLTTTKTLTLTVLHHLETGELLVKIHDPSVFPPKDLGLELILSTVAPRDPLEMIAASTFSIPRSPIEWLPSAGVLRGPSSSVAGSSRRSSVTDMEADTTPLTLPAVPPEQRLFGDAMRPSLCPVEPVFPNVGSRDPRLTWRGLSNPPVPTNEWRVPNQPSTSFNKPTVSNQEWVSSNQPPDFSKPPPVVDKEWGGGSSTSLRQEKASTSASKETPVQEARWGASSTSSEQQNKLSMPPPSSPVRSSAGPSKPSTSNDNRSSSSKMQEERHDVDMTNRDNKRECEKRESGFGRKWDEDRDRSDYSEKGVESSSGGRGDGNWKHDKYQGLQSPSANKPRQQDRRGSADSTGYRGNQQRNRDEDMKSNKSWGSSGGSDCKQPYQNKQPASRGKFGSRSSLADDSWETPAAPKVPANPKLRFTTLEMKPGTSVQAYGTFLLNPWEFYVQLNSSTEEVELLMEKIADACKSGGPASCLPAEELDPKDAILAKHTEDGLWYRAQVTSVTGDKVKVKFVDYGNDDEVEVATSVKAASPELVALPAQAIFCRLRGAKPASGDRWGIEDIARFAETLQDALLQVDLVAVEGLRLMQFSVVVCCDGGVCLNKLFGACPASLLPVNKLPRHVETDKCEVQISWFKSPGDFHITVTDRVKERNRMLEEMKTVEAAQLGKVALGDLVLAPNDQTFYRGTVVATRDTKAKVYNVDEGTIGVFQMSKLRAMPESLKSTPAFSKPCELVGVAAVPGPGWPVSSTAINEVFKAHLTFLMSVVSLGKGGRLGVTLTHPDGSTSLAEQLVKKGLAREVKIEEDRLAPGYSCFVYLSFTEGLSFYVHQAAQVVQLEQLQEKLQTLTLDGAPPHTNQTPLAATKNPEDGKWYRVRPTAAASEEGIPVLFVDYGNELMSTDLKELPKEICKIPAFATRCQLPIKPLSGKEFSKKASERFESLILDEITKSFKATTLAVSSDGTTLMVDLTVGVEDKSVTDILVSEKLALPLVNKAYISNVESHSEFFIQLLEDETKLHNIEERLATGEFENLDQVEVGTQCIAKFTGDESWYRATVMAVTENATQVLFVDYGNSAVATEFKKLPADMASVSPLAIRCTPINVPSHETEIKMFLDQAMDGTVVYQVLMIEVDGDPKKVILMKDGKDVIESIKGKCKLEIVQAEPKNQKLKVITEAMEVYAIESKDKDVVEKMDISEKANLIDAYISHCISPSQFYYQKVEDENKLFDMQERLTQLGPEVVGEISEGLVYAAQFKDDETFYRGKVLSLVPQSTFFIDYGNTGEAIAFKSLPEDLKNVPPFAQNASLKSIPKDAAMCEKLKEILSDECTVFQVEISGEGNNKINVYKAGQNLFQVVGYTPEPEPQLCDVIVSHYIAPNHFYVQMSSDIAKLDALQTKLEEGNFEDLSAVEKDTNCVAKFPDDEGWYRARVTTVSEQSITVSFYDYGNSATATEFKKMTEEIQKIPPFAKLCHLPFDPQKQFNEEAKEKLAALLGDPEGPVFQADMPNSKEESSSVGVTLLKDGKNIMEVIGCDLQVEEEDGKNAMEVVDCDLQVEEEEDKNVMEVIGCDLPVEEEDSKNAMEVVGCDLQVEEEDSKNAMEVVGCDMQVEEEDGKNAMKVIGCDLQVEEEDKNVTEVIASDLPVEEEDSKNAKEVIGCDLQVEEEEDKNVTEVIASDLPVEEEDGKNMTEVIACDLQVEEEDKNVTEVIACDLPVEEEDDKNVTEVIACDLPVEEEATTQVDNLLEKEIVEIDLTQSEPVTPSSCQSEDGDGNVNDGTQLEPEECTNQESEKVASKASSVSSMEIDETETGSEQMIEKAQAKVLSNPDVTAVPTKSDTTSDNELPQSDKLDCSAKLESSIDPDDFEFPLESKIVTEQESGEASTTEEREPGEASTTKEEMSDEATASKEEMSDKATASEPEKRINLVAKTSEQEVAGETLPLVLPQGLGTNLMKETEAADSSMKEYENNDQSMYITLSSDSSIASLEEVDDNASCPSLVDDAFTTASCMLKSPSEPDLLKQALANQVKLKQNIQGMDQSDESLELYQSTSETVSQNPQITTSTPIMTADPKGSSIVSFIPVDTTPTKMFEPTSPTSSTESPPKKQIRLVSSSPSFIFLDTKADAKVTSKTPLEDKILPGSLSGSPAKKKKMSPPEPKLCRGSPRSPKQSAGGIKKKTLASLAKVAAASTVEKEAEKDEMDQVVGVQMINDGTATSTKQENMDTEH